MKESRFTESQIAAVLQEGELGFPVAELCRKHGISHATYYVGKVSIQACRYPNYSACAS